MLAHNVQGRCFDSSCCYFGSTADECAVRQRHCHPKGLQKLSDTLKKEFFSHSSRKLSLLIHYAAASDSYTIFFKLQALNIIHNTFAHKRLQNILTPILRSVFLDAPGTIEIPVLRHGSDLSSLTSVWCATRPSDPPSASPGVDYIPSSKKVEFKPGKTEEVRAASTLLATNRGGRCVVTITGVTLGHMTKILSCTVTTSPP